MPAIFKAMSPHYAVRFFLGDAKAAWVALGGVVLCISGSEAIFADLGHFSRRAVSVRRPYMPINWLLPGQILPSVEACSCVQPSGGMGESEDCFGVTGGKGSVGNRMLCFAVGYHG